MCVKRPKPLPSGPVRSIDAVDIRDNEGRASLSTELVVPPAAKSLQRPATWFATQIISLITLLTG